MGIDEGVVPGQLGVEFRDVADPAHVRGELIHVLDAEDGVGAVVQRPEVCGHELVGGAGLELGPFQVHAPDPKSVGLQPLDEVVADETTGPRDEGPSSSVSLGHGVTFLATRSAETAGGRSENPSKVCFELSPPTHRVTREVRTYI